MLVSDYRWMTWEQWSAALMSDNGLSLNPVPEEQWREWASQLRDTINASDSDVPDPYQFETWQDWEQAAALGLEQEEVI